MASVSSDEESRRRRFIAFCALYFPGTLATFLQFPDLNKASVFLYIICALHVQVRAEESLALA